MLPDSFNPIFVLKIQRFLTFFLKDGARSCTLCFVCPCIVVGLVCFLLGSGFYLHDVFALFSMIICFTCCVVGMIPGIDLARKRISGDLFLFTPLSGWQVLHGYILTGLFYSYAVIILGIPVLSIFLIFGADIHNGWNLVSEITFFCFLFSTVINVYVLSFFAGVRTSRQFWTAIMLAFVLYFPILYVFYMMGTEGMDPHNPYDIFSPYNKIDVKEVIYFAMSALCLVIISYALARLSYSWKKPFALKQITLATAYIVLLAATCCTWLLLLGY